MASLQNINRLTELTLVAFAQSIATEAGGIAYLMQHSSRSDSQRIAGIRANLATIQSDLAELETLIASLPTEKES